MANGYAQGVRLPYAAGPAHVRRWVERELGASVVEAVDATGGMSPGPAAVFHPVHGGGPTSTGCRRP